MHGGTNLYQSFPQMFLNTLYFMFLFQNSKTALSLSTINVKAISRDLLEAYESLGYDVKATLMFGDSIKCPWTLSFTREYLLKRVEHINEYTVDIIKRYFRKHEYTSIFLAILI